MKNTTTSCGLVLLALAGMRPVLAQAEARAQLARAVVIEEEERDLARAAVEYRKVVAAATDADLRAEAGVRLGTALLAMGKKDEARAVLAPLAAEGGTIGERARLLLQDQQQDDPVFAARVREALALTRRVPDQGAAELSFLGRAVVPYLMQALRAGEPDPATGQARPIERSFLAAAVKVMGQLGGPTVADGLRELARHSDVVVRRTCAETFDQHLAADLLPAAQEFLADTDASVRLTAIRRLKARIASDVLVGLVRDSDRSVRDYAFHLAGFGNWRTESEDIRSAFLAATRAELAREAPVASISSAVAASGVDATEAGRAVALALLRHPAVKLEQTQNWNGNAIDLAVNAHADDLVATAEALAARDDRERLHRLSSHFVAPASRKWDRTVLPQALRLMRLGAFADGGRWLLPVLQPVDVPVILADLGVASTDVLQWISKQSLPVSAWKAIAAAMDGRGSGGGQDLYWLAAALLRTRADEGVPLVLSIAAEKQRYQWIAVLFAEQPEPTPAMHEAMLALLGKDFGDASNNVADGRNRLFVALAKSGREDAVRPLANAYRLGLGDNDSYGIGFFRSESGRAVPGAFAGKVVDACLATGSEQAFAHAMKLAQGQQQSPEIYAALCKHALATPRKYLENLVSWQLNHAHLDPAAARALYVRALGSQEDAVFAAATSTAPPPLAVPAEVIPQLVARARTSGDRAAIFLLGRSGDVAQAPLLRELMGHRDPHVRQNAMNALTLLLGSDAADALLPLAQDPVADVRRTFAELALRLLDRRCAPALLRLLRDESTQNRELAQKALEAIEFFHTQTARWQRILTDANLDAPTAAEALVKQATTGKDKAIRLAAIASLGTLKVPETLPVLIQLMQDTDAEIAAAARAAVAKINGQ